MPNTETNKKQLAILGSTGSIGTQALDVVRSHADNFEVYALTAQNQVDKLISQAIEFQPDTVIIGNKELYPRLKSALASYPIKVYAGAESIEQIVQSEVIDIVLTAIVGYSGLKPTIEAIKAGKTIALANKETMVVAGEIINRLALEYQVSILPVDSEHSAIFQCLEFQNSIEKIILTASGGPFRTYSIEQLEKVTKDQALKHPNWNMGAKITIDSASMMNKGFEVIEAKWLFNLNADQIEVLVHPQSIIHSMIQFQDGSIKAQMGLPDMKLPILYAFSYPFRLPSDLPRLDFSKHSTLTFELPDKQRFNNLNLAFLAMETGGSMPCTLNAANEVAVEAFLQDKINFPGISRVIEQTMEKIPLIKAPTYDDYVEIDRESRIICRSLIY